MATLDEIRGRFAKAAPKRRRGKAAPAPEPAQGPGPTAPAPARPKPGRKALSVDRLKAKRRPGREGLVKAAGGGAKRSRWKPFGEHDAVLHFGKHTGKRVRHMAMDVDDSSYLRWMLTKDFDPELLRIVRDVLMSTRR